MSGVTVGTAATALFVGLSAVSAISQISNASSQANMVENNAIAKSNALKTEGDLAVQQKAKEVRLTAARQTASFLSSGLTMEGTPTDVINETFSTGIADVQNIGKNYQTQRTNVLSGGAADAKSINNAGRTAAINTIASSFTSASFAGSSGAGSFFGDQGTLSRDVAFGSSSGVGPIKGFGGLG